MKHKNKLYLILIVFVTNYLLDRITKILAIEHLQYLRGNQKPILGQFFSLSFTENAGAFLSVGNNFPGFVKYLLFIILPLIFCIYGLFYCYFNEKDKISIILIVSIIAGGIGNIQDRIFNDGKVTDFLIFGIGNLSTGILNIADISITIGGILLFLHFMYNSNKEKKHPKNEIDA